MKKKSPFAAQSRQRQLTSPDNVQDYVRVTSVSPILIGLAILNALDVLSPSDGLTQLIQTLFGIEDRAKQYYISSGKNGEKPEPEPDGGGSDEDGGEVTPVTPE